MRGKADYFENLDGLRFLCFLSVFLYHSFDTSFDYIRQSDAYHFIKHGIFQHANLGVNFFFVLSGFLITFLLLEEKKLTTQIDLARFWARRILRIWPLFYFIVFFGFIVFPFLKILFGQIPAETASFLYYASFLNNFDVLENGTPDASMLGVLWSVAVEEQFYFVWPIVLCITPVRRYWIAFCTVIAVSWIYRVFNHSPQAYHFHTLSCIGDMAIGSLGAWLMSEYAHIKMRIQKLSRFQIALVYLSFAAIFFFRTELFYWSYSMAVFERSIIACVMLFIILEQCYARNSFFKLGNFKLISTLGTISYGLYCFHFIGILAAKTITNQLGLNTTLWQVALLDTVLALIFTIVMSRLSYDYFEMPFLKLKERFSWSKARVATSGQAATRQQTP